MHKVSRVSMYLLLALALLFQLSVLNYFKIFGAMPDLLLIMVVFFGLFFGEGPGIEAGIAAGVLKDLFCLDFFFINTFILAIIGFVVGLLNTKFFKDSRPTQFILVFMSVLLGSMLHYMIVSGFVKSMNFGITEYLIVSVMPNCIYTGLVGLPVFSRLGDLYELHEREEFL